MLDKRLAPLFLAVLAACLVAGAARADDAAPAKDEDLSFCKEVLILHHSHVDVGYTHPQSMYWELQKGYLEAALDMLDRTESWPDDISRPRWTVEVTAPLLRWLETAAPGDVERLKKHIRSGRVGISGFQYNTTPLSTAEGLARQLYPCRMLREKLGADIRTANQHDVNGIPWTAVDLLLDSQIELLIMAINLHLGGTPMPRPAVYRWQGPSGREILVMNGEHYTMFDQWANPASRDLDAIQKGINRYLRHVKSIKYPYDFVYLTAANAPFMYDNAPPNQELPDIIRQWNEAGRQPRLRMVTPNELLARIKKIPRDEIPLVKGDWTDYWNFGSASSAVETSLTRRMTANAAVIDLVRSRNPADAADRHTAAAMARLWEDIHIYNEHTWGAHNSLQADDPFVLTQWHLKAFPAYDGKPLSDFHLRRQLHLLAGNPWESRTTAGVLVVNPTGLSQEYFVPGASKAGTKRIESEFLATAREATARPLDDLYGPVRLEPLSWQIIPWQELKAAPKVEVAIGPGSIETDFYKLSFESKSGKITALFDKQRERNVVPAGSPWGFFQLVHERPVSNDRKAFHIRDIEGERFGRTGWRTDWEAARSSYTGDVKCEVERHARSATLVIRGAAEGIRELEQRVTLHADSPMIDLSARFLKEDVRTPEAVYFAFPLGLKADWRAHFDTAGVPTELDAEQIPGTCRDWVTVDTFAAVHEADFGAALYCPDAPMVQIGDFNWAKKQDAIPRRENPLLLAWPLNNYWETNFRASQPGTIDVRYSFSTYGRFDAARVRLEGEQTCNPPVTHVVLDKAQARGGRFVRVAGQDVVATYVKPADDGRGVIVRLMNLGAEQTTAELALPGTALAAASICDALEANGAALALAGDSARCPLAPRRLTTVRLVGQ